MLTGCDKLMSGSREAAARRSLMIRWFLNGAPLGANSIPETLLRQMRAIMLDENIMRVTIVNRDGVEYKVVGE